MRDKEQILEEISELFFKSGYEKTSIRDISKALKISKPGLYYHFTNKQDMLFSIIDGFLEKHLANLREKIQLFESPEEKLVHIIRNHINFFVNYPAQTKVVIYEIYSLEEEYVKIIEPKQREYLSFFKDVLSRIIEKSGIETDVTMATFSLVGTLNWVVKWYKPGGRMSPDVLAENISAFYLRGLKGEDRL